MSYTLEVIGGQDYPLLFSVQYRADSLSAFEVITLPSMQIRLAPGTGDALLATFKTDGTGQGQITGSGTTTVTFAMTAAQTALLMTTARGVLMRPSRLSPILASYDVFGTTSVGSVRRRLLDGRVALIPNTTDA